VYIDDIVDAILKALENCYIGPLNVGTGIQTSLDRVAQIIATNFQAELVSYTETEDKGPTHMQSDNTRIKSTLNWTPKTTIKDGLALTIKDVD
jgi:UDP-glucuronate decarboxylase